MVHGYKKKIELGSSNFKEFIESGYLYIDKTKFIEDIIYEATSVLLFTRPRRTGKSLNLKMLQTFLDCSQDTKYLFRGLYIESSEAFKQINKYPVIFLDFKRLDVLAYKDDFKKMVRKSAQHYLSQDEMDIGVKEYLDTKDGHSTSALLDLCESLYLKYKVKPYIIIHWPHRRGI